MKQTGEGYMFITHALRFHLTENAEILSFLRETCNVACDSTASANSAAFQHCQAINYYRCKISWSTVTVRQQQQNLFDLFLKCLLLIPDSPVEENNFRGRH